MLELAHIGTFSNALSGESAGVADTALIQTVNGAVLFTLTVAEIAHLVAYAVGLDGSLTQIDSQELRFDPVLTPEPRLIVSQGVDGAILHVFGMGTNSVTQITLSSGGMFGDVVPTGSHQFGTNPGYSISVGVDGAVAYCAIDPVTGLLQMWSMGADGQFGTQMVQTDDGASSGPFLTDMTALARPEGDVVLAVSVEANALVSFKVGVDGSLRQVDLIDPASNLWVSNPMAVKAVTVDGQGFAIIAAAGSSTLSVVLVAGDGSLTVTDHILDTLDTRFDGAQVLGVVEHSGRAFVAAAGADDGITVFEVLQNGQLLSLNTLADQLNTTLDNVSSLDLTVQDERIDIYVGSSTEAGITVFSVQISDADLRLAGTKAEDTLRGGDGDDILLDSAGADEFFGGNGADVFVLIGDGERNVIRDFDPTEDSFDISNWAFLRSLEDITFKEKNNGAELIYGDDILSIVTLNKETLTWDEIIAITDMSVSRMLPSWAFPNLVSDSEQPPVDMVMIMGTEGVDVLQGGFFGDYILGLSGNDSIGGLAGADVVFGGVGDDQIKGNAGSDSLSGDSGDDRMFGGIGWDQVSGDAGADWIRADDGFDVVWGGAGEDRIWGNNGNDQINGGDDNDVLSGGLGSDEVSGDMGHDQVFGNAGSDSLWGGAGDDELSGNAGFDTIFGGDGDDILSGGISPDRLFGGDGDDVLTGENGLDNLFGGAGADVLSGNAGSDTLFGDQGDDVLSGGINHDVLYGGSGNDSLSGGSGKDSLFGGAGDDTIYGNGGADVLLGGAGNDRLFGGDGADVFVFSQGADRIARYEKDSDSLSLDAKLWGGGELTLAQFTAFESGTVSGGVLFDFGSGNTLTVMGEESVEVLFDDVSWF